MIEIRQVVLFFCWIGILVWGWVWKYVPRYRAAYLAPLSWLIHAVLFYTVREVWPTLLTPLQLNTWSNAVRLQGIFLLIAGGVTAYAILKNHES
jgi:hypothetical protein